MEIISRSDLGYRLTQSFSRNESKYYKPNYIWTADKNSWPADWEGRTILALVSLAKATGKEPAYLEEMIDLLPSKLNELGYLGEVYPNGAISEQQLAGHSWLLRGLIEYSLWKKTDKVKGIIETLVRNLYVPVVEELDNYYVNGYKKEGTFSGSIIASRGKWLLSTDIGCAFISCDGISQAYEFLGWDCLKVYLQKMREKFITADLYGGTFQTHATLSCIRGLIRTYKLTGLPEFLETAINTFELYREKGITENYSNINRFGVAKWTEPCAIIDSYMCCIELYRITKKTEHLDFAQKVYFNSISHCQLPNGGMGLQNCPGHHGITKLGYNRRNTGEIYEAYWCCTMRGGDGLSYVSLNQCFCDRENEFTYVNFFDSTIVFNDITITEKTEYPCVGKVIFDIENPQGKEITLKLYMPSYLSRVTVNSNVLNVLDGFVYIKSSKINDKIEISFDIPLIKQDGCVDSTRVKFMHGNVLLGAESDVESVGELKKIDGCKYESASGDVFDKVGNTIYKEQVDIDKCDIKILFAK